MNALTLLVPLLAQAPVQTPSATIGRAFSDAMAVETAPAGPALALPVIDYRAPDGSFRVERGIVAGVNVTPNAKVGLGFFESQPKRESIAAPENPLERTKRRSRKAAVGFSLKF